MFSQPRVMVESHQAWTSCMGMARASIVERSSLLRSCAPHNSSRGMVRVLRGATLVLDVTRLMVVEVSV